LYIGSAQSNVLNILYGVFLKPLKYSTVRLKIGKIYGLTHITVPHPGENYGSFIGKTRERCRPSFFGTHGRHLFVHLKKLFRKCSIANRVESITFV
jgi:hypothetical protein